MNVEFHNLPRHYFSIISIVLKLIALLKWKTMTVAKSTMHKELL